MTAVLITGMSGTGKSTVLTELARRGHRTVDTDEGDWLETVAGEPLWREEAIRTLLDEPGDVFIAGTVANQGRFYDRFAAVVLLTAPIEVIVERIGSRTTNEFGKRPGELAKIFADIGETEPMLRKGADLVIDTTADLEEVVSRILRAGGSR